MAAYKCTMGGAIRKVEKIVAMLSEDELAWDEIAARLHCHKRTAGRILKHMMSQGADRRIYICRWIKRPGVTLFIPIYKSGNKPNKRKPKPLTVAEVFQRVKNNPIKYATRKENYRKKWHEAKGQPVPERKVKVKPASPFAALGL